MEKDFNNWNEQKKKFNKRRHGLNYKEGEVWWCAIGINIGFEIDGKNSNFERPVLIIKAFNKRMFLGIPLTTQERESGYQFQLSIFGEKVSLAACDQIKTYDSKRLIRKSVRISYKEYLNIVAFVQNMLLRNRKSPRKDS